MRILLTNDDGIFSEGLKLLADALSEIAEVVVVAPDREQSASGHSLTLNRPLRMKRVREHWYAVDGTPTDCVNLGVQGLLKEKPADLVVSGINFGLNVGGDVTYSGTVSAAFEASMHQLPGIAFSQEVEEGFSFERAARLAHDVVTALIEGQLPSDLLLNVNFPSGTPRGVRWTRLGKRVYKQTVIEKRDPKGRKYYWIAGTPEWEHEVGTDYDALLEGYVSVTPLHLDLTDYRGLEEAGPLRERLEALAVAVGEPR
ncbi:MAG: 5'/3'-nucleotidase SurE [bacterium]|nr:5'/3'-nucleotidase SurE [bacterium]